MSRATDTTLEMTTAIIASLQSGEGNGEWKRTWNVSGLIPTNALTGKAYTGMNRFWLMMLGVTYIATNKQWKELESAVQWDRNPKPAGISLLRPVFYPVKDKTTGKPIKRNGKTETVLGGFAGFTGYPETDQVGWTAPVVATLEFTPIERAETLIKASGMNLVHGGDKAMHVDSEETVYMPDPERFDSILEYYRTLMHEGIHWTGNAKRCNRREVNRLKYGSNAYAYEELIAEIGSTFLCNELGLGMEELFRTNHIKYIKYWMDMMKGDSGIIVKAASEAEKACKLMLAFIKDTAKPDTSVAA